MVQNWRGRLRRFPRGHCRLRPRARYGRLQVASLSHPLPAGLREGQSPHPRHRRFSPTRMPKTVRLQDGASVTDANWISRNLFDPMSLFRGCPRVNRCQFAINGQHTSRFGAPLLRPLPFSLSFFFLSSYALFCSLLHFLAFTRNSTLLFSCGCALFSKNTGVREEGLNLQSAALTISASQPSPF